MVASSDISRTLMKSSIRPRVIYAGAEHCLAVIGPVYTLIANGDPTEALVNQSERALDELEKAYGKACGMLVVVKSNVRPPSEAARHVIRRVMADCARAVVCGAWAIEGQGFVAAANRGALSMMMMLTHRQYPMKVYGTVRDAAGYVRTVLGNGVGFSAGDLVSSFEQLRSDYVTQVEPVATG
jgi:hypothetical protein